MCVCIYGKGGQLGLTSLAWNNCIVNWIDQKIIFRAVLSLFLVDSGDQLVVQRMDVEGTLVTTRVLANASLYLAYKFECRMASVSPLQSKFLSHINGRWRAGYLPMPNLLTPLHVHAPRWRRPPPRIPFPSQLSSSFLLFQVSFCLPTNMNMSLNPKFWMVNVKIVVSTSYQMDACGVVYGWLNFMFAPSNAIL